MSQKFSYDHLNAVPQGDTKTTVKITLKGFRPYTGGSGYLDEGQYGFEVIKAAWETKKGGKQGRNLHFQARSTSPEGSEGVTIHGYLAFLSIDKNGEDVGARNCQALVYSIASAGGQLDKVMAMEEVSISPEWFLGKKFYAQVRDSDDPEYDNSQFGGFIGKDVYEANPGASKRSSKKQAAQAQQAQTSRPEVMSSSNGTKPAPSTTESAVDSVLGF